MKFAVNEVVNTVKADSDPAMPDADRDLTGTSFLICLPVPCAYGGTTREKNGGAENV